MEKNWFGCFFSLPLQGNTKIESKRRRTRVPGSLITFLFIFFIIFFLFIFYFKTVVLLFLTKTTKLRFFSISHPSLSFCLLCYMIVHFPNMEANPPPIPPAAGCCPGTGCSACFFMKSASLSYPCRRIPGTILFIETREWEKERGKKQSEK
jgi:hypothetical protein